MRVHAKIMGDYFRVTKACFKGRNTFFTECHELPDAILPFAVWG